MSDTSADIKEDFINELKVYIPEMRDKANRLDQSTGEMSHSDLSGLHRLVHTIRGAASLVKLNNLSAVASEFEKLVEDIIGNRMSPEPSIKQVFVDTIDFLEAYSQEVPCNDAFAPAMRGYILDALTEARQQGVNSDGEDMLAQLFKNSVEGAEELLMGGAADLAMDDIVPDSDRLAPDLATHVPDLEEDDLDDIDLPQEELLEGFYLEAEDHFQDLGKALGALEEEIASPVTMTSGHKELLRIIRRSVHTVKGAAAVIQLKEIAAWGHEFEDVLDWLYEDADRISPDEVKVIAAAADMLERFVSAPQEVDDGQLGRLRLDFKSILGATTDTAASEAEASAAEIPVETPVGMKLAPLQDPAVLPIQKDEIPTEPEPPAFTLGHAKTLRVDMARVESLANLGGELTIALSAFDQDMDGLGNLISEIDRARLRMNRTARDLELGYEVKAIQSLSAGPSVAPDASASSGEAAVALSEFDLLELDRYSELSLIIRSLSETAVDVSTISHQLSNIYSGFDAYLNRLRILLSELHEKTMRIRMTPMSTLVNRMRRTVRETAAQLDKKVYFSIEGEHIELDKIVWDRLADPLMHLLRNAIDHGIESAADRKTAGKPETATVRLAAAYQGNQVVIRVTDDGAGLDLDAIRETMAASLPGIDANTLADAELADTLFQPGFSTRQTISEVSGRGVGLDVVKGNILDLKGNVRVEASTKGVGTSFRINLPLTMAVMQALLFKIGGKRYATALYDIKEILRVNPEEIASQGGNTITINGQKIPFFRLQDHVPTVHVEESDQWPLVLVVATPSWQGAVAIDRTYSQKEIVIKSLGSHLTHVKGVVGATVMGDGEVVPILNLEELLKTERDGRRPADLIQVPRIEKSLEVLVVDDSVSVRMVVSRLMKRQGWKVETAKDGVEAIEQLHARRPDVVLLDVEMPRMNGYEFLSSIRSQADFKDLPVIMLTSRATGKHREKAEALGVNGFVTKPYDDAELVALVMGIGDQK